MTITTAVVFDLGNVCIKWSPKDFFIAHGYSEADAQYLVDGPISLEWHSRSDCGLPMAENVRQRMAEFPGFEKPLTLYLSRWQETIPGKISGTIECLDALADAGMPIYGLTNFPGDMYPGHYDRFDFMKRFLDVVVSGDVGLKKPDPRIYALAIDRFGIVPEQTLFIDDRLENCQAAAKQGFQCHHFSAPETLATELKTRGLL